MIKKLHNFKLKKIDYYSNFNINDKNNVAYHLYQEYLRP